MKGSSGTISVAYCRNARCTMCDCYKAPSRAKDLIILGKTRKLQINVTSGELSMRNDLKSVIRESYKVSGRILVSTDGFFCRPYHCRCNEFSNARIRILIEGLKKTIEKFVA